MTASIASTALATAATSATASCPYLRNYLEIAGSPVRERSITVVAVNRDDRLRPADGHMHFTRMDDLQPEDFEVLKDVHEQNLARLPDLLLSLLDTLAGDGAYPLDRRTHSLQAATRALRDGRDEEYVVVTLLHDIGEALGPLNHGEVVAAVLKPFISEANHWMVEHHPLFQTYFYGRNVGLDPNGRDVYRDSPYFDRTAEFCARYDEVSFDPNYPNEPIETFVPMVRRVLAKAWQPASPATS